MNANKAFPPGVFSDDDIKLVEESVRSWKKCFRESVTNYALPWASVVTALKYYLVQRNIKASPENKVPQGFSAQRSVVWFAGNLTFAVLCCLPSCYLELRKKLAPLEGKIRESQGMVPVAKSSEGTFQSHDDISFQSSLDPKIDGPSSDFSHLDLDLVDIDISNNENLQLEDVDKQAEALKIPTTTYDDLRKRNRESYYKQLFTSSSQQRDDQLNTATELQKQKATSPYPSTTTRKNKYGDDME